MVTKTDTDPSGLQDLDPASAPARDATHLRAIIAAAADVENAEVALRHCVQRARDAGDSWTAIGAALGVSKQAAQQRFAGSAGLRV